MISVVAGNDRRTVLDAEATAGYVPGMTHDLTDLADRTAELYRTHPEFLAGNALVILTSGQLDVLTRFLEDVRDIGLSLNLIIERCVDENPGYNFSWDNDGTREQDDELDRRIERLCKDLGFTQ